MGDEHHVQDALDLYTQAAAALGSGRVQGTYELALMVQGGSFHRPQASWQAAPVASPTAGPLADRIAEDLQWIRGVVVLTMRSANFYGTGTIRLVACPRRGLLAPTAEIRETVRSTATAVPIA